MSDRNRAMSARSRLLLGLAALAWAFAVFVAYYYTHKPISLAQVAGAGSAAVALLGWLGTLALAHWLGRSLAPWLGAAPPRERLALRVGLGLGALGLFMLVVGFAGLLRSSLTWGLMAVGIVLGLRAFWGDCVAAMPRLPAGRAERALAAFVLFSLGTALFFALAPPAAWDALVYHLTGPKLYVAAGRLHHNLDLPYLGFPHWPAMLYTWALLTGGAAMAQLLHLTFAALTLALLPGLANRAAPGRGWLAGALLLSAPALVILAGWPYADWMSMFAVTAAFTAALRWQEGGAARWLVTAGVLAGLSLAAKYNAAGATLGLTVAVGLMAWSRREGRSGGGWLARPLLLFGGAAALALLPWLVKNWALTGNPVSPFLLPGKYWDPLRAYWFGRFGTGPGLWRTLAAPWSLMARGAREDDIGPLLFALFPLLLLGWRGLSPQGRRLLAWALAVFAAAAAVWLWGIGGSHLLYQYRLLYPVFPLAAVLAAAAFDGLGRLATPQLRVRWVFGGLVALALGLNVVGRVSTVVSENPLAVVLGLQSQDDYLAARLGLYYVAMQAVNDLPEGHRVVFLWEPRSYYCESGCEPDALLDRWWHLRRTVGDSAAIAARWRSEGVTHVFLFQAGRELVQAEGFDPLTPDDWADLDRLAADDLTLVTDFGGVYRLYALEH